MRAVGYQDSLPIEAAASLVDIELPMPQPSGRDLLVQVCAISVNPVDTKVRMRARAEAGGWKVLGYDAAGTVVATGPDASLFMRGPTPNSTWWTSGSWGANPRRWTGRRLPLCR